ncbi:MAG: NTF2 fold immunity protein [Pyrinomonadaceae bacterium]
MKILLAIILTVLVLGAVGSGCTYVGTAERSNLNGGEGIPVPIQTPYPSVSGGTCQPQKVFASDGKDVFSECEIRKDPDLFNNKTVRVFAKYGFMLHGSYLTSDSCGLPTSIEDVISVGLDEKDRDFLRKEILPVAIVAIGEFHVEPPTHQSDTIYDNTPYHFRIVCLEKVVSEYVKDEPAAIDIALKTWIPVYGKETIDNERPYVAELKGGVWHVHGSLPKDWVGGVAEAWISQKDGKVIRYIHGK